MKVNLAKLPASQWINITVAASAILFFLCSSIRHALFQSNAYDLGWYDQLVYFISQGKPPIVTFADYHLLGDHVALIFYPIALFYKISPNVHWLFAIQAIALAWGIKLVWQLARQAGIDETKSLTLALAYLLYPLVFNVNLYDFHPEVIAIPGILAAVFSARQGQKLRFCFWVLLVLSCKVVLSLTVAAMGIWLLLREHKRWCGAIALGLGIAWFIIATQYFIPRYSGIDVAGVFRYSYLGESLAEIIQNLFLKPQLILGQVFSLGTLEYLLLLLLPVAWGLSIGNLSFLIPALPTLAINILSNLPAQRNLVQHYSVPLLPFLFLAVIATVAAKKNWLKRRAVILTWCGICFLLLAKYTYFGSIYTEFLDTREAMKTAIAQVDPSGSVLTTSQIAPHLVHRSQLKLATEDLGPINIQDFDYVLLNQRYPGWSSSPELVNQLIEQLQNAPEFQLNYQQDQVFLFQKTEAPQ